MSYMTASGRQTFLSAELAAARTRAMLHQALNRTAESFGFASFMLYNAPSSSDMLLTPLIIETSAPAQNLRDFDRGHLLRIYPLVGRDRDSAIPRCWNLAERAPSPEMEFPRELRTFLESRGLTMGMHFPVNASDGERLAFSMAGNRNNLSQAELNELCIILLHAATAYNSIKRNGNEPAAMLSAREMEVVRWTAQGKTSVEIGQILTLSDHTVNAYMTNAIKKLNCVNRTQLVAKAIRLKLIS
ncbi:MULTISPECIES: helix-turn-helix transcriptional regulator [unclassified Rhizobium]|uniref:helix-turn-helix transcriptional regulator n=1 Tax=unclassified Rhizobium TaxID=2613769 RepID=UPI001AD98907|nr:MULTISPECIES: LuxR family transcriptional regulator [unclassified Rhizobium]MBO9099095.1 autoinducer binding domain-containing protein [Rhizobium sp. L58/93]MBO9132098.1 autoinducer binding domain-containing protein [Rhizobium sp. B209b/85]MBO9185310.1 autoinducer binding domain-containing protein [Rhizobium sp. E27B/91]QXZ85450.1 autoinducer binding domain-containing protein [Rhizobium sp. K1/93]QXZ90410.1 autoinducer binding domain-containing protein [Rhizobium sp. K15/93]